MTIPAPEVLLRKDLAEWGGFVKALRRRLQDEKRVFAEAGRPWPPMLEQLSSHLADRLDGELVKVVMHGSWLPPSRGRGSWAVCPVCQSLTWLRDSEEEARAGLGVYTCSQLCKVERKRPIPKNALQERLLEYTRKRSLTFTAVGQETGISTLSWWYESPNHRLEAKGLRRLATFLSITYDRALEEAGGVSGEEHRADAARRNLSNWKRKAGKRIVRAASKRGGERTADLRRNGLPAEHATAIRDAVERRDNSPMALALKTLRASPTNALLNPLWVRLRHHPKPGTQTIRQWEREEAAKHGVTPAAISGIWRPYLAKRNLRGAAGRKPASERQAIFLELDASQNRTPTGKRRRGFWDELDRRVAKAEGVSPGVPTLKEWARSNRLSTGNTALGSRACVTR